MKRPAPTRAVRRPTPKKPEPQARHFGAISDPYSGAWQPTKGKKLTQVAGAVGTVIFDGFVEDLRDVNPRFRVNQKAMRTYEEMYRTDPQVYATLQACTLPIRAAKWTIEPPATPNAIEKEAAELVKQNLFGGLEYKSPLGLTVSQHWDEIISHALMMLRYGASCMEEVYRIDGNRVSLAMLLPLMPDTYWRWHVDTDGMTLAMLEQLAYRGAVMDFWKIPADKLVVFTYQKEGAFFPGRPMTRAMYRPWFFKQKLEIIEAIAGERNGMGFPVGNHAEQPDAEDRKLLNRWVQQIATHQSIGIALPHGADLKLVGVQGRLYPIQEAISRYAQEITRVGLVDFINLGVSESGSRGVGDVLQDFFYTTLQTNADLIGRVISAGPVRRLCDFNFPGKFGVGGNRYPVCTASNVKARSILSIMQFLMDLTKGSIIRPDDEFEAWVRRGVGAPDADPKTARLVSQAQVTEKLDGGVPGDSAPPAPGAPAPGTQAAPNGGSGEKATTEKPDSDAAKVSQQTAQEMKQMSAAGKTRRPPRGIETHVQADAIEKKLDDAKAALATTLRTAKRDMIAAAAQKVAQAKTAKIHEVSLPLDQKLVGQVKAQLGDIYKFGGDMVAAERASQLKGRSSVHASAAGATGNASGDDTLQLIAETTVGKLQNQVTSRAASAALDAKTQGPVNPAQLALDLDDQPDGWVDNTAGAAVHQAIANGRQDGFAAHRDEIEHYVYSAMLDANTCGACADADGKEGSEDDLPAVPNPDCDGGSNCRCMWVAVFKDEGGAA